MKNPVNAIKDFAVDLAGRVMGPHTTIGEFHAADGALRQAHADAEAERIRLLSAGPPRAAVIAAAEQQVDAIGAAWGAAHGAQIVSALGGHLDMAPNGELRRSVKGDLLQAPALAGLLDAPTLMALAPALVKQGLRTIIGTTDYVEGPAMDARLRLIPEIDEKIEGFVKDHAKLVKDAGALKVALEDLPVTVGRRIQAANARERWERDQVANAHYYRQHPNARPPEPEGAP